MLGRSDGTLNPNGVRFGSAEIYNIVEHFSEIADSLCVSKQFKFFQSTDIRNRICGEGFGLKFELQGEKFHHI